MTSPDELMRAVENFRASLDGMGRPGVSQIAQIAQLKVLVARYPGHAQEFLKQLSEPVPTASDRSTRQAVKER